ncbi:MAG: hypothetical protein JO112_16985, partial [Planctomycetes bacterium]|nr:hypothetical protein [Planctomycetota bacterium]
MKRVLPVLGLLLIFLGRAAADEPPYLDFVKGLRDMGYPDLALQYLQKLKAKPPQGITPAELTLESGLTGVEAARLEPDLSKRAAFYAQARTDLEDFLKGNASHPRAAEANLALARLVALQGQTELSKADRDQTAEGKEAQRQKARPLFEQADKLLGQVAGQAADPKAKLQAQMEQASNLFNEARTYNTQKNADLLKRADILKQARGIFETIAANNLKDPIGWEALAWVGRCYQEVDEGDKALQVYNRIFQERGPVSDTGRRLAQYYRMILLDRNPKAIQGDALAEIAKSGESWRAAYPRYLHTPDGYGVTFLTAEALLKQGVQLQEAMKTPKGPLPPKVLDLFARAEKLYGELEGSDNDYADLASQRRLFLVVTRSGQKLEGHDITALTTFTDCFEQARVQLNTMFDEDRNFKGQTDEERKQHQKQHQQHLDQAVALLQRALTLTGTRVTPDQLAQARNLLSYCYIQANKSYQAAVLADFTVHSTDPSLKSAQAAGAYALQAYAQALGDQQTAQAPDEVLNADRRQLRNVADFIQKTWTTEDVADAARHQIGRLLLQEKKYAEAVA